MIEVRGQRVRAQAQFHQRFGFRQAGGGESMIQLIVQHGVVGRRVPLAVGVTVQVTLADERLLNFLHALRLQVEARQALPAGELTGPPFACS